MWTIVCAISKVIDWFAVNNLLLNEKKQIVTKLLYQKLTVTTIIVKNE